jgi:hypothetical protein
VKIIGLKIILQVTPPYWNVAKDCGSNILQLTVAAKWVALPPDALLTFNFNYEFLLLFNGKVFLHIVGKKLLSMLQVKQRIYSRVGQQTFIYFKSMSLARKVMLVC